MSTRSTNGPSFWGDTCGSCSERPVVEPVIEPARVGRAPAPGARAHPERSEGQRGSQDASRLGWHRTRSARDPACSSGVGTSKGRPFGAAYGGACRPDL